MNAALRNLTTTPTTPRNANGVVLRVNGKAFEVPALDIDGRLGQPHPRVRLERRVVAALIAHLMMTGFRVVGVWDGDDFTPTDDAKSAMEVIFNLDECSVRFARSRGFNRARHESTRDFSAGNNAFADREHGVLLVLGNGVDIVSDWNYDHGDGDGFNRAMRAFDAEAFA